MKYPMMMTVCKYGFIVTYRCYKLPGHGKNCENKNTNVCLRCRYSKAEMTGETATRLMGAYGRERNETDNMRQMQSGAE